MTDQAEDEKKDNTTTSTRTTRDDLLGLAAIAGGFFAGRGSSAPGASTNLGYQGEIPDYSLVREQVLDTYDANRTPGSLGQRYFSDARYVPTASPDITGIRQALFEQANVGPDSFRAANYARRGGDTPELAGRGPTGIDSVIGAPLSYDDRGLPGIPAKTYTEADVTDPTQTQYFPDGTMYIPNYGFVNANDPASMTQLTMAGVEQRKLAQEAKAAADAAAAKAAEDAAAAKAAADAAADGGTDDGGDDGTTYTPGAYVDPDGDGKYQLVGDDGETLSGEYNPDGTAYTGGGDDGTTTTTTTTYTMEDVTDSTQMQTFPDGTIYVPGYGIGDPSDTEVQNAINAFIMSQLSGGSSIGFKGGGYLDGGTDGMADDVPAAIIENNQPAALSDGEFVVPADVVSHLGNGNSDAGAEQLYSMMEEVRKARTGSPKQGKEINPNEYLPLRGIA